MPMMLQLVTKRGDITLHADRCTEHFVEQSAEMSQQANVRGSSSAMEPLADLLRATQSASGSPARATGHEELGYYTVCL